MECLGTPIDACMNDSEVLYYSSRTHESEEEMKEYLRKKGITLIERPATKADLKSSRKTSSARLFLERIVRST